jgi:hypothetical protein
MANELSTNLFALDLSAEVSAIEDTSQTLSDEVLDIVQDASFSWEDVLKLFNTCLFDLAGKYLIPDLERWESINTDPTVNHVRLPADFMRNLRYVHSVTHNRPRIKVYGSVVQMFRWYSVLDRAGAVRCVAIKGRDLYYQLVPSTAEELKINYFAHPARMRTRDDKPDILPEHLLEPLLVSYACWKIFEKIEDALDEGKPNATKYKAEYMENLAQIERYLGPDEREPQEFPDEMHWDLMV